MTHHPHVHMIVPGGGLSEDGTRWIASRANFLVHVHVLASKFRGKFLAMLGEAHADGKLNFFNTHAGLADPKTFKRFLGPLRRIEWRSPLQAAIRRSRAGSALSLPIHAPRRHLKPTARCRRRWRHRLPL